VREGLFGQPNQWC